MRPSVWIPACLLAHGAVHAAPLETAPDLAADLLLSDPLIAQPVHLSFDERGRLWVVEYRQYPAPAGLQVVARDDYWRVRYDRMPPPPPHPPDSPFHGKDRISIHEDTDGDGSFDSHKVFVDGLNICTSLAFAADGVWVLNPPYLLHYPDEDGDDIPDARPVVHLKGFGIEDTHSNANSLRWGPDGWLYGCNGSTVSLNITCPQADPPPPPVVRSGQCIWRYHPPTHRFEIFAEGGGNSFGIEIDAAGHLFSGHNGGDTRGFHFLPGGYYRKNFGKHGELSNSHAYGHLPAMIHPKVPRFSHHFVIYEADHLPERYHGKLLALDILHNNLAMSEITPLGSTFKTRDLERPVRGPATFRPQHMITGPDGALYLADWGDSQVNHYLNHEGQIDTHSGRVYRLRAKDARPELFPVASDPVSLLFELGSPNRARRQTALRLIRETVPLSIIPSLHARLRPGSAAPSALDGLWGLHALGALTPAGLCELSRHRSPDVQRWALRLMHETGSLQHESVRLALLDHAANATRPDVLAELLFVARGLPSADALRCAEFFVARKVLDDDPCLPLMTWWLLEAATREDPSAMVPWTETRQIWSSILFRDWILERMARRLIDENSELSLAACATLLDRAPDDFARRQILEGVAEGLRGVATPRVPPKLREALLRVEILLTPELHLRLGFPGAIARAFENLARTPGEAAGLLDVLAELHPPDALDPLLGLITAADSPPRLVPAAIRCLQSFEGDAIPVQLLSQFATFSPEAREAAARTLATRLEWSQLTMQAVADGTLAPKALPLASVRRMLLHRDPALAKSIASHFPELRESRDPVETELIRLRPKLTIGGRGNLARGKELFGTRCAACHKLYDQGRDLGPDLTSYQRDDLDALLLAIIAPNADIREGFETAVLSHRDGSMLVGLVRRQDAKSVELVDPAGARRTVPRDAIRSLKIAPTSLMPAGLLDGLGDHELRDLFAFLTQVR